MVKWYHGTLSTCSPGFESPWVHIGKGLTAFCGAVKFKYVESVPGVGLPRNPLERAAFFFCVDYLGIRRHSPCIC